MPWGPEQEAPELTGASVRREAGRGQRLGKHMGTLGGTAIGALLSRGGATPLAKATRFTAPIIAGHTTGALAGQALGERKGRQAAQEMMGSPEGQQYLGEREALQQARQGFLEGASGSRDVSEARQRFQAARQLAQAALSKEGEDDALREARDPTYQAQREEEIIGGWTQKGQEVGKTKGKRRGTMVGAALGALGGGAALRGVPGGRAGGALMGAAALGLGGRAIGGVVGSGVGKRRGRTYGREVIRHVDPSKYDAEQELTAAQKRYASGESGAQELFQAQHRKRVADQLSEENLRRATALGLMPKRPA